MPCLGRGTNACLGSVQFVRTVSCTKLLPNPRGSASQWEQPPVAILDVIDVSTPKGLGRSCTLSKHAMNNERIYVNRRILRNSL